MRPSLFGRPGVSAAIRILQISKQLRENPGLGYATAFISVGVASGLQWLAQDQYAGSPFLTIYPAVIVTALVGGTGAGFLAAARRVTMGLFHPDVPLDCVPLLCV